MSTRLRMSPSYPSRRRTSHLLATGCGAKKRKQLRAGPRPEHRNSATARGRARCKVGSPPRVRERRGRTPRGRRVVVVEGSVLQCPRNSAGLHWARRPFRRRQPGFTNCSRFVVFFFFFLPPPLFFSFFFFFGVGMPGSAPIGHTFEDDDGATLRPSPPLRRADSTRLTPAFSPQRGEFKNRDRSRGAVKVSTPGGRACGGR